MFETFEKDQKRIKNIMKFTAVFVAILALANLLVLEKAEANEWFPLELLKLRYNAYRAGMKLSISENGHIQVTHRDWTKKEIKELEKEQQQRKSS